MRPYFFSVLEKHDSGNWWYHIRWTYGCIEDAIRKADEFFSMYPDRTPIVLKHRGLLPQAPCFTRDFVTFQIGANSFRPITSSEICYSMEK